MAPHLGGQILKNANFGGVNRLFPAKLVKSKNTHIIKTTASAPTKFCTAIKTTKCPSWVVRAHNESKMADGRRLGKIEKSSYLCNDLINFDQIWHGNAAQPS